MTTYLYRDTSLDAATRAKNRPQMERKRRDVIFTRLRSAFDRETYKVKRLEKLINRKQHILATTAMEYGASIVIQTKVRSYLVMRKYRRYTAARRIADFISSHWHLSRIALSERLAAWIIQSIALGWLARRRCSRLWRERRASILIRNVLGDNVTRRAKHRLSTVHELSPAFIDGFILPTAIKLAVRHHSESLRLRWDSAVNTLVRFAHRIRRVRRRRFLLASPNAFILFAILLSNLEKDEAAGHERGHSLWQYLHRFLPPTRVASDEDGAASTMRVIRVTQAARRARLGALSAADSREDRLKSLTIVPMPRAFTGVNRIRNLAEALDLIEDLADAVMLDPTLLALEKGLDVVDCVPQTLTSDETAQTSPLDDGHRLPFVSVATPGPAPESDDHAGLGTFFITEMSPLIHQPPPPLRKVAPTNGRPKQSAPRPGRTYKPTVYERKKLT